MSKKGGAATIAAATSNRPTRRAATAIEIPEDRHIKVKTHLVPAPVSDDGDLVLAPGGAYELVVQLEYAGPDPSAFLVRGDLELCAIWEGDASVHVDDGVIDVSILGLSRDGRLGGSFKLVVSERALHTTGWLRLTARDRVTQRTHTIYERTLVIEAELRAPPQGFASSAAIRLDRDPDPQLAVLHVHAGSEGQILVNGYHPSLPLLQGKLMGDPIDFGEADIKKYPSHTIADHVLDYSKRALPDVHAWLNQLLGKSAEAAGGELAILVAEHVDARVPWEMLTLEDRSVLGARAVMTRWMPIHHFSQLLELDVSAVHDGTGGVLAYLDLVEVDQDVLPAALSECHRESCANLYALHARLKGELGSIALVLLACHGIFTRNEEHEVQLGSLKEEYKRINRLDLVRLEAPSGPKPLVFVNACHSARLGRGRLGITGLPEVFLGGFARGYLGTLGAVSQKGAAKIAASLLERARLRDGVCLAEFLLELRREAAAARARDVQTFVDTFMYVFYGSPRDRLALAAVGGSGGDGG